MHIATKLNAAPIVAQPFHLTLKHHYFLKQKLKNFLHARIIQKSMLPWASPTMVVKKHMPRVIHNTSAFASTTEM